MYFFLEQTNVFAPPQENIDQIRNKEKQIMRLLAQKQRELQTLQQIRVLDNHGNKKHNT